MKNNNLNESNGGNKTTEIKVDNLHNFLLTYPDTKNTTDTIADETTDEIASAINRLITLLENLDMDDSERLLPGWITEDALLLKLNRSKATLRAWRLAGKIPHSKLGGVILYQISDLEQILKTNLKVQ